MQNVIVLLVILIPVVISIIAIVLEKKKKVIERNEMFPTDEVRLEKKPKIKPVVIDAVSVLSDILRDEVEKLTDESTVKPKSKRGRKPAKKKKPEFPIEPTEPAKPKSKRGRKPKNKDKKGGDQMLLS